MSMSSAWITKAIQENHVNNLCLNCKSNSGQHVKSSAWITKTNSMSLQFWQCHSTLASQTACRHSCIKISNSSQLMIHKDDNTIVLRCWCTICSWILYCNFKRCSILSKGKCIHRDLHIAGAWHCIRPPWNSIQYSPYCVYKLDRKRTIRKNISRFQSKHDAL